MHPAATIVADDDETQGIEVYPEESPVRIPLSELMKAIELANEAVHGESYYDGVIDRPSEDT